MPMLLTLFHKIETEGTLSNSFYEATVMLCILPWRWNSFHLWGAGVAVVPRYGPGLQPSLMTCP